MADRAIIQALDFAIKCMITESKKYAVDANLYHKYNQDGYIYGKRAYEQYTKIMGYVRTLEGLKTSLKAQKRMF